ncbi:MAG: Hsp70 family protein, partial [Blautia sp.]|nr:Hsp70 family protein [Blautia sp.]
MKKFYDCGIDLGTTNSCIAKPNMNNTCTIVENKEGSSFTPSVVSITKKGMVRVGAIAKRTAIPGDVRKEFKRDMGTDTEYTFQSSGMKKTPVNLSAEVLGSLKRDFEARFIDQVAQNAVITVPAAFTLMQCEDTKNAAMEAGFQNVILLQEPIAAAIAYGAQPDAKEQYWLVFDYGGGTLDVSIISTKDDHLDNINSRGNNRMGGKDLDKLLYEKVILPKMQEEYNLPHGLDVISTNRIMEDVENCKKELSNKTSTLFIPENLGDISDEDDEPIDFSCSVSRQEFESVIRDVVLDAVSIARKSLTESGISEMEIDRILLVGGSTFIPLVREELRKEFSIKLDSSLNPMTVVAEGAALFAASQMVEEGEAAWEAPGE